jgi:hypothetical protein
VLLTPLDTLLAIELADELALMTGPPGVTVCTVEVGAMDVETVVVVDTLREEEDEDDGLVYVVVVVVDMPEEITEVAVEVTVGSGQVGRTMVEVRPSVMTIVVDCADAVLRSATRARRDLR